jgi:hypothetical protein
MEELIPHDVVIDHCPDWSSSDSKSEKPERHNHRSVPDFLYEPRSSSASFDLPLSSDNLFLFSRGAAAGSFKLVQSSDLDPNGGVARVAVVAKYRLPSALEHVKVCSVTRRETEHGVVIFVSCCIVLFHKRSDSNTIRKYRHLNGSDMYALGSK